MFKQLPTVSLILCLLTVTLFAKAASGDHLRILERKSNSRQASDCYDILTEMIRSSNFPFGKINPKKVNILIDEDNREVLRVKLFIDTEGTGTLGWLEYHVPYRKLLNISIDPDKPEELTFDTNYASQFEQCRGIKNTLPRDTDAYDQHTFKAIYDKSTPVELPNAYSYNFINEEKAFIPLPKEFYQKFSVEESDNFKIARLPVYKNFKPILLITYDASGQSKLYLIVLSPGYEYIDKVKLYDSRETERGTLSTTYEIDSNYLIVVKEAFLRDAGRKVIQEKEKRNEYTIDGSGKIVRKKP